MANEAQLVISITASKNGTSIAGSASIQQTMAGDSMINNVQSVGTASEVVVFGDVTANPGCVFIKNQDSTNYVEIDSASTFDKFPQKILPGKFIVLLPQTVTIYAKSNTAACNIQVLAIAA